MRELKQKQYWGLYSLLAFILMIALGYFVLYPMINNLKDLNIKTGAKTEENQALTTKIAALTSLSQSFAANPDKVKMLDLAIPNDDLQAEVVATLGNIAGSSGVTITTITQAKSEAADFTLINLGFESSYAGLKLFLESVENNIRYIDVGDISLTRAVKAEGGEGYVTGTMTLNLFKYAGASVSETQTETTEEVTNE